MTLTHRRYDTRVSQFFDLGIPYTTHHDSTTMTALDNLGPRTKPNVSRTIPLLFSAPREFYMVLSA